MLRPRRWQSKLCPTLCTSTEWKWSRSTHYSHGIRRRRPRGILMGGGSPCQGNSAFNKDRMGLHDERSLQPIHLCKLRDEVAAHPECSHLLVLALLENVASMPSEVLVQYNQWLGASPIMIDAAPCGWVHRRRYYWLVAHKAAIGPHLQAPDSWDWVPHNGSVTELRWQGTKPLPSKVVLQQGFTFMMDPGEVLAKAGVGAMHTFTREFFHPTDRVRQATPAAAARFFEDDRRFPPAAYEETSLVWKGSQWRQLLPEERAQIMGVPPGPFSLCKDRKAWGGSELTAFWGMVSMFSPWWLSSLWSHRFWLPKCQRHG